MDERRGRDIIFHIYTKKRAQAQDLKVFGENEVIASNNIGLRRKNGKTPFPVFAI
jgi:hypothetical protein